MSNEPTPMTDAGNCPKSFDEWWNDHENGCPTLVLDNDEQFACAVWNAALADLGNNLRSELTAVTEQRDALAKAIITHRAKAFPLTGEDFDQELWEALQSLTPNEL